MHHFFVQQFVLKPFDIHLSMPVSLGDLWLSGCYCYRCSNKAEWDINSELPTEGDREQGQGKLPR